jgi:DnaJ-class molecular chaperone
MAPQHRLAAAQGPAARGCCVTETPDEKPTPAGRKSGDTGRRHRCRECGGLGRVPGVRKVRGMGKGMGSEYGPCPACDGMGWVGTVDDWRDERG